MVNPVTVTAEVAVKRASKKFVTVPAFDAAGNMSRKVPRTIRAVKAAAINCVDDSLDSFGISNKTILLSLKLVTGQALGSSLFRPQVPARARKLVQYANSFKPGNRTVLDWRLRPDCHSHELQDPTSDGLDYPTRFGTKSK